MNSAELYQTGRLQDAIDAAIAEVKGNPTNTGSRNFLCELLCFAGAFDRADKQLDALGQLFPELLVAVALWRHLLRAAKWRKQFFEEGRLPEFVGKLSFVLEQQLKATVLLREGDQRAARTAISEAQQKCPNQPGACDGKPFDHIRDLDDVLAPVLEVFTANGKYYWIAWDQVASLEMQPVKHPRDLLWRSARIFVRNGPEGDVHLPVLYPGTDLADDDAIRLGRSTDWKGGDESPVRGIGQRMLLIGEEAHPFLELKELSINPSDAVI